MRRRSSPNPGRSRRTARSASTRPSYVERDGQKAIVVGKGGQTIKTIGEAARAELEKMFGRRVHLFLHSKVAERWGESRENYREWGLEFPKDQ